MHFPPASTVVTLLFCAACISHGQASRTPDPNTTDAVEQLWFTGSSTVQLSIGGHLLGPLPQHILVSFEKGDVTLDRGKAKYGKGRIRIGYAFTPDVKADLPKSDEEIGPNEASILRSQVTGWIDGDRDIVSTFPVQFAIGGGAQQLGNGGTAASSIHAYFQAFRLSGKSPISRRHLVAIDSDLLVSPKYLDLEEIYASPNDEPILDLIPGDLGRIKPHVNLHEFIGVGVRKLPMPPAPGCIDSFTLHAYRKSIEYDFYLLRPQAQKFLASNYFEIHDDAPTIETANDEGLVTTFFLDDKGRHVAVLRMYRS